MTGAPLAALRRIRSAPATAPGADEVGPRCELCARPLGDRHGHLVDVEQRALLCACRGCYLLFTPDGAGGGHFRAVPDRWLSFPEVALSPAEWDALQIPVGVAFLFLNSTLSRIAAFYPSPAGATESLLPLEAWDSVVSSHPALATLRPDVEAILLRTDDAIGEGRGSGAACYLVPIDACYQLVGELRRAWRGFDGGPDARAALAAFFAELQARAVAVSA